MAGRLVPLVLIPRFSCYSGPYSFKTIAMDVTDYKSAIVNVWRGAVTGSAATHPWTMAFEESTDQDNWSTCTGGPAADKPDATVESQYTLSLTKRWFRVNVTLDGSAPIITCWAVGFHEEREN